ncbi:MAG: histidine kinase [bacterium]|nr:histidine kinase [bacterium]
MNGLRHVISYHKVPVKFTYALIVTMLVSVLLILQEYTQHILNEYDFDFSWLDISLRISINYLMWLVFIPSIYLISQVIFRRNTSLFPVIYFTVGTIAISFIHRIAVSRSLDLFYFFQSGYLKDLFGANSITTISVGTFSSMLQMIIVTAVFWGLDYQKRYINQEKELARAQLSALRMQLQPHFLFNTLHSISSMIDLDVKQAQKMITKLGGLLRSILETDHQQLITVREELDFIKQYLDLEQIRFQEHIGIKQHCEHDSKEAIVPSMILQPLVENAIKHGTSMSDGYTEIILNVESILMENQRWLKLEVTNTSESIVQSQAKHKLGIGLKNVRNRLSQLYRKFEFDLLTPDSGNKVTARILIPFEESKK